MTLAHLAVVVAAGGSARLGQPKQLLTRDGETLVHRAARLALATSPVRLLVVLGAAHDELAAALQRLPCERVRNEAWRDGLASSLRCVAERVAAAGAPVLVLGCDQPALELAHLECLLSAAGRPGNIAAASRYAGVVGSPAVVPSAWFAEPTLAGDRGFGARLRDDAAVAIVDAPELALDVDTPDDLREAQARGLVDHGTTTTLPRARPVSR